MPLTPMPSDEPDVTIEEIGDAINQLGESGPDKEAAETTYGGAVENVMIVLDWVMSGEAYQLTVTVTQPTVSNLQLLGKQLICNGNGASSSGPFVLADSDEDICVWVAELVVPRVDSYELELVDVPPEGLTPGPSLQTVE